MRPFLITLINLVTLWTFSPAAHSSVLAKVYRSSQTMEVYVDGVLAYRWPVSTGLGYNWTKPGTFKPQWFSQYHRSSRYNNAPMPFSVFYDGNRAIHGTKEVAKLGNQASKGCVRLSIENARTFFYLAKQYGKSQVTIRVH